MKRPSVLTIVLLGLFSTVAASQRRGRADSLQDSSQEIPTSTGAPQKKRFPEPNWDVRYESGSLKLKKGRWLKGAFVPAETANKTAPIATISVDQMRDTNEQAVSILAIPADDLRAAYFDPKAEKDSDVMQRMPRSGCHYAERLMPKDNTASGQQAFVAWETTPGAFSRGLEHLNRKHPVRLVWTDVGTQSEVVLMVDDCEYASFLANLRRFAGQRWQEIGHELKK